MQSATTITDGTIRPQPETALSQKSPGSPPAPATAAVNDEAQGGLFVSTTAEPPPHPSTKLEAIKLKDPEVKDFGWNSEPKAVPSPLVHGLANDDLYTLIRRFNKVSRFILPSTVFATDHPSVANIPRQGRRRCSRST